YYAISGEANLSDFSATLVAQKDGMVPAMDWFDLPAPDGPAGKNDAAKPAASAPVRDLVMSAKGGELHVVTTIDGRPASGVTVSLHREGGELRGIWARGTNSQQQKEAEQIAYPQATTDVSGLAHFDQLIPGKCEVTATDHSPRSQTTRPVMPSPWSNYSVK